MPDLIVAGAGPAGLATALYATRAGLEVVVVDPRTGPLDKACGEGLMPSAVAALEELGIELPGIPLRGIRYVSERHSAQALFSGLPGRGVRRTDLHNALMTAVHQAGIEIVRAAVSDITQDTDRVSAAGLSARYLVAADGLHSPIRRALQLDRQPRRARPRWGQRCHFTMTPWTDLVEVHWSSASEAYVTPVGENLIGVAILSSTKEGFHEQLNSFPDLRARLPIEAATSVRGAGPLRQRTTKRVEGRVLLIGDAAGYVDALTGEGITVALHSAQALVECLAADQPHSYEELWRKASRDYRVLTTSLLWLSQKRLLRPAIVPIAAGVPILFRSAVNRLAH